MSRNLSSLPGDAAASLPMARAAAARWRPGLPAQGAMHAEIFAPAREAGGAGCALAFARDHAASTGSDPLAETDDRRAVLWVQDRAAMKLGGRPYRPGLPPALRHRLVHVVAEKAGDALFAIEEGLRCRDLAFVLGEFAGNPRAFDFTASRRLTLAAERHGVPLWLVRLDARAELSSARLRWNVRSAASDRPRWNGEAPGLSAWHAELFRARAHAPGEWILRDDGKHLVAARPPDRSSAAAPARALDLAGAAGG